MNRVISIGYGRHVFADRNPEQERLKACAELVAAYDMIIFSKKSHALEVTAPTKKLTLYPTQSAHAITGLVDAFLLARTCLKRSQEPVTITTQDPFETALIGILLKKIYGVKLVIQEHGDFFGTPHWRRESLLNRVRYYFGLWALRQADVVRVVSMRTKERFEARGIKSVVTLPVQIDTAPLLKKSSDEAILHMIEAGAFVFLSVARFVPQKNLPLLLRAFATVHQAHNQVRLVLVGNGVEESHLRTIMSQFQAETQAAVTILPWSQNVGGLMQSASAYVLSSNYEGWGRVLIEALVAKLPIVTTDVGCATEVVVDGLHGFVVPVDSELDLAQAMLTLVTDHDLYTRIKKNLEALDSHTIPGADIESYASHWANIFGR